MIRPINSHILVEQIVEEKTHGGIIIPDVAQKKSGIGIVKELGDGHLLEDGTRLPCSVKVGDKIAFMTHYMMPADKTNKNLFLIKEGDILGLIEE